MSNVKWGESVQIIITGRMKTTSVLKNNPVLILPPYQDSDLCPVKVLKQYVECTKLIRNNVDELFISFVKPHKVVVSQTISRWLVEILSIVGIDTNNFKGHSFRHASTSKAARSGVCVDTILQRVGWSKNSTVFARYYN